MSRGVKITIWGLYNYNNDIFDGLTVPDGLERDVVINEIITQCGDFELLYPSYTFMKMAITNWCAVESSIWSRLYNTELIEYEPLWNVDATITESGTGSGVGSTKGYNSTDWLDNAKSESKDTRTTRRTGNIGVTSSQQLLQAERDVADFSTVKYISDSFKRRFCIMIY